MTLYFLRHGSAVEPGTPGIKNDAERPLTPRGIKEIREVVSWMKIKRVRPQAIFSSPHLRAIQTALLVAQGLPFSDRIKFSKALIPTASFNEFFQLLLKNKKNQRILFVGHQPALGAFVSELTHHQSVRPIDFKKGDLYLVDVSDLSQKSYHGKLKNFFSPNKHA